MVDGITRAVILTDGDDIEPAGHISQPALEEIALGHFPDLPLFGRCHRFLRTAIGSARPRLDLDKNKSVPVAGDDVDLTSEQAEAGLDDPVSLAAKVFQGHGLAGPANGERSSLVSDQIPPIPHGGWARR